MRCNVNTEASYVLTLFSAISTRVNLGMLFHKCQRRCDFWPATEVLTANSEAQMLANGGRFLGYLLILVVIQLVAGSKDSLVNAYEEATKKSLLWGPYRPNAYLGIRPRLPRSLITGLFWFNSDDVNNLQKIRHYCDQNLDFQGFGWEKYDPRIGGSQFFKDNEFHVDITTDFVKNDDGNWGLKVKGVPRPGFESQSISIVFYAGLEGDDGMLTTVGEVPREGLDAGQTLQLIGRSNDLGDFMININDGPATNKHKKIKKKLIIDPTLDPSKTHHISLRVPDDNAWQASEIFNVFIQESIQDLATTNPDPGFNPNPNTLVTLRDVKGYEGNFHLVQKIFKDAFEFDIFLNTEPSKDLINEDNFQVKINETLEAFDKRFENKFELQAPYNTPEYTEFAKEVLSNLLGGIGYFFGDHLVDRETELNEDTFGAIELKGKSEGPFELFTSSPSRTFFPRGFYWDEGFHLIPVLEYDSDLALEIVKSWFNLIDDDGWIAREQIPGAETRSKVPAEFQVQSPHIANPPTLMLVFTDLLKKAKDANDGFDSLGDVDEPVQVNDGYVDFTSLTDAHLKFPELLIDYAEEIYPKLQLHYEWFRRTQKGELEEFDREPYSPREAYRWKGRTFTHCLPSGLDDYPRANVPDIAELNVDLISWIGTMTRSMKEIAELLGKKSDYEKYKKIEYEIQRNIEDLHWSEECNTYCDVSVDQSDDDIFVCHKGYISLFPFLLKLLEPSNPHLKHVVELIADPEELWSDYGIRSLSKQDEFYKTGEDYWRSKIWYPINYLIVDSLHHYGTGENAAKLDKETLTLVNKTYTELRGNLVENCYKNWKETGYVFENYNDEDGHGSSAKHFTGWTSLVVPIMKMPVSLL